MGEAPLPFPQSQCHACASKKYVRTASSVFVLCTGRPDNKYPRQPMSECPVFKPVVDRDGGDGSDGDEGAREG